MNPLRSLVLYLFSKRFQATGPSLTFVRLCTSRHLRDLQQIAVMTMSLFFLFTILSLIVLVVDKNPSYNLLGWSALASTAAAIVNWTYQSGSRRIGSVDLFANEIAAICRVCLIVDFAMNSVAAARLDAAASGGRSEAAKEKEDLAAKFVSQEEYTPVYNRNISDLQPFDVDVVTSVTCFYTYRKTMMDYLRLLSISSSRDVRELRIQMIYMQFLMYESAREAISLLVEFEPNQVENMINILCSELTLFAFLKNNYENDFRGARLDLRVDEYKEIMRRIQYKIDTGVRSKNWERAYVTFPELKRRYRNMCVDLNLTFMPDI